MDLSISEQQEILLYKACKNNGVLSMELATATYSKKQSARSAIDKLRLAGYIERTAPGRWKVVKVTDDIKQEIKHEQEQAEKNESEAEEEESEYQIQQV